MAGATPATAKSHTGSGLSTISTTWGRNSALGPGVEGEQNTAETVALAGDANAVKGIIFSGPKSAPTASPNGSHAILGITYGAGHSVAGDLCGYFSGFFDTRVGGKKEVASYAAICSQIDLAGSEILFLSDIGAELDAAAAAGLQACQLLRDASAEPADAHPQARDFADVNARFALS